MGLDGHEYRINPVNQVGDCAGTVGTSELVQCAGGVERGHTEIFGAYWVGGGGDKGFFGVTAQGFVGVTTRGVSIPEPVKT